MKFPEEYIKHGNFLLHSGQHSDIFYDVNAMLTEPLYLSHILYSIPWSNNYVGIATFGEAIVVGLKVENPSVRISIVKDKELKGKKPEGSWILIDDVVTTGRSLLEAISLAGSAPEEIIVAVDRRPENRNPIVKSVFEI